MNATTYPRDYKHASDGKRAVIRYRELRVAAVPDYSNPNASVEKFVLEGDLEPTGEPVSYWLGPVAAEGVKLVSLFRKELARRAKAGKSDFEQGELIVITQSDQQRPSRTSGRQMWDYTVEFEHAAPPPSAAELLLGTENDDGDGLDEVAGEQASPGGGQDDDIPFQPTGA